MMRRKEDHVRRVALVSLLVPAMVGLMATSAFAANAHLKGRNPISFSDGGLTLSATVSYTGLGNFDTQQNLTAQGNVTATCTNPAGATQPPGQNPAPVTLGGTTAVPKGDIKNGNVTISTTTGAPTTPIPGAPGCPNPRWSEDITDVAFTSATITLFQDSNANGTFEPGELVVTVNCTFNPPTSDGAVPSSGFSCTS
jgi:hypothetical protein